MVDAATSVFPDRRRSGPIARESAPESRSFEIDEGVIADVAGPFEPPEPVVRFEKAAAGELPVEQVHLFLFVAKGFDADVLVPPADAFDLAERQINSPAIQVVQRVDGDD